MSASPVDHVVSDYLNRLDVAAGSLPPARRAELLQEIREHIDAARAAGAAADEATVRTMLDRLGEPEEIVAAALEAAPAQRPGFASAQPSTGLELAAALLLTVGSFVPLIGWAVGAVLLWGSRRWSTREKLLGTLVVPGGPAMAIWLGLYFPGQTCVESQGPGGVTEIECTGFSLSPWIGIPLFLGILIAPFIVAGVLYSRASERAAELRVQGAAKALMTPGSGWSASEVATVLSLGLGGIVALLVTFANGLIFGGIVAIATAGVSLVLLWVATRWRDREKVVATVMLGITVPSGWLVPITIFVGMISCAVYLTVTAVIAMSPARRQEVAD